MLGELQLPTAASTERQVGFDGLMVVVSELLVEIRPEMLDGCVAGHHACHYASPGVPPGPTKAPASPA